ncbi:MAG TPA: peptidase S9, partial [Gammaproteobacteria bacterium]|nr:peptidase S9 [Gammaproteobacteria bacterium]
MKHVSPILLLLGGLLATPLRAALTHDPSLHWKTLTSTHFEIHFHDGEEALAREVASIAERTHERLTRRLNWRPAQRTQLILTDRFDFSNGSATPFPRNTMTIIV